MSNMIDQSTNKFSESPIFGKIFQFFSYYLTERNIEKTLSMLSEEVYSIGTGDGEVAVGKSEFRRLLEEEIHTHPEPFQFEMSDYTEKKRADNCWDSLFNISVIFLISEGVRGQYHLRVTANLHWDGCDYIIDTMHASEASILQEDGEFFPLKFASGGVDSVNRKTKDDLLEIVSQIIPGGVVGGYAEPGYPLYAANEQFLRMAGYSTYDEFKTDIHGMVINSIHPEDQQYVIKALDHNFEYRDQYEIQYRMRKKDGSYFWVHDVGKKTKDSTGRNAIISILTDISEQVIKRRKIEKELARDSLTGLYNRKSGEERISSILKKSSEYLFFMMDMDDFKRVNDIYGHVQGDEALKNFGKMAKESFRSSDIVCRMGGDEFIIFIHDFTDIEIILNKIKLLLGRYSKMMDEKWPDSHCTLSAGGIYADQYHSFAELYKLADDVLYEVKHSGKGDMKIRYI